MLPNARINRRRRFIPRNMHSQPRNPLNDSNLSRNPLEISNPWHRMPSQNATLRTPLSAQSTPRSSLPLLNRCENFSLFTERSENICWGFRLQREINQRNAWETTAEVEFKVENLGCVNSWHGTGFVKVVVELENEKVCGCDEWWFEWWSWTWNFYYSALRV